MFAKLRNIYEEFPRLFWIVVMTRFIDALGGTLLFPFFALYITQRFSVGMTQAGVLLGMSSLFGMLGSTMGGALADRFGRRRLILFGLIFSALSSLMFGLADDIAVLYPLIVVVGLLSSVAYPAHEAMLADILPEGKRQEGFAILRAVFNAAWIFGTALGGLIAARSFFALFVTDSVLSGFVAILIFRLLPETRPAPPAGKSDGESLWRTALGYRVVLRDLAFVGFIAAGMVALIVYQQQYSTLSVYLRDVHQIDSGRRSLCGRGAHVRPGDRLLDAHARGCDRVRWRDVLFPNQPSPHSGFFSCRHARPLYGHRPPDLVDPGHGRSWCRGLPPRSLQPSSIMVHRGTLVRYVRPGLPGATSAPWQAAAIRGHQRSARIGHILSASLFATSQARCLAYNSVR